MILEGEEEDKSEEEKTSVGESSIKEDNEGGREVDMHSEGEYALQVQRKQEKEERERVEERERGSCL